MKPIIINTKDFSELSLIRNNRLYRGWCYAHTPGIIAQMRQCCNLELVEDEGTDRECHYFFEMRGCFSRDARIEGTTIEERLDYIRKELRELAEAVADLRDNDLSHDIPAETNLIEYLYRIQDRIENLEESVSDAEDSTHARVLDKQI